jgi:hypothetical protein
MDMSLWPLREWTFDKREPLHPGGKSETLNFCEIGKKPNVSIFTFFPIWQEAFHTAFPNFNKSGK